MATEQAGTILVVQGDTTLRELSRRDATAPIPVVVLAGQPAPPADGALRPDGWIEKPFDIDVLLEHVGRVARRLAPIASYPASADRAWPRAAAGAV